MMEYDELRHLSEGPRPGEVPGGAGLIAIGVTAQGDAAEVVQRAGQVLSSAINAPAGQIAAAVPGWFARACAPERTPEQAAAWLSWWRGLGPDQRREVQRTEPWTLAEWAAWLEPGERTWHWWRAAVSGPDSAVVEVVVPGWPTPVGSLVWLLRAAGAVEVDSSQA